jgi:hypothetical protein
MIEVLFWYSIFALATGITACYELLAPVFSMREAAGLDVAHRIKGYVIFFLMSTVLAPFVIFCVLIPRYSNLFQAALYEGVYE